MRHETIAPGGWGAAGSREGNCVYICRIGGGRICNRTEVDQLGAAFEDCVVVVVGRPGLVALEFAEKSCF
eukprot:scaffold10383_cov117-Isochrysis_galbana.AAC.2